MNPELQRLWWLGCTPPRIGAVLASLAAILALGWLIDGHRFSGSTASFALASYALFTIAWGGHLVAESVADELRARTWDQQRMSALSPWTMTWGKLLGAAGVPWLAGIITLFVYGISSTSSASDVQWLIVLMASTAVLIHGLALFGALLLLQRAPLGRSSATLRLLGVLAVSWVVMTFTHHDDHVRWYGQVFGFLPFVAVVISSFAAWLVFGAERMMCEALQVRTLPWAIIAFVLFVGALGTGLVLDGSASGTALILVFSTCGLLAALCLAYFSAFALKRDPLLPRRLAIAAGRGDWRRVSEIVPPWLVTLVLAAIFALLVRITAGAKLPAFDYWTRVPDAAIPLVLYAARDLVVFFGLNCNIRTARLELAAVIYLALVYWLLPAICGLLQLGPLRELIAPLPWPRPDRASAILVAQLGLASWWARQSYRERTAGPTAGADARS